MIDTIKKIDELFKDNTELQSKYEEELKRIAKTKETASDGETIQLALKNIAGIDLSLSDIEKIYAIQQAVDDEEIEKYNGGMIYEYQWCAIEYCCVAAFKHPYMKDFCDYSYKDDEDQGQACWSDYNCAFVYHDAGF